jgi:acyl-CoA reductase-like NAD-dependent aldehyde dehydrogenase
MSPTSTQAPLVRGFFSFRNFICCDAGAQVTLATHDDVNKAIDAAVAAAPAMAALGAYERKGILEKVSPSRDDRIRLFDS